MRILLIVPYQLYVLRWQKKKKNVNILFYVMFLLQLDFSSFDFQMDIVYKSSRQS